MTTLLRIDASARKTGSVSRDLNDRVAARLNPTETITRDLADGLPLINEAWVGANFTPKDARDQTQLDTLALSDTLIDELSRADVLLIGLPIYNFGVPAALKAWIDQAARAGVTFQYTADGPKGLLTGKRAIVTVASGGTEVGSAADFATGYMAHVLGFIGIDDVEFVTADKLMVDSDASLAQAHAAVDALKLAA